VLVMATLRSDFLGAFQLRASDLSRLADHVPLGPMREESYFQVIEEPARRAGLHLEPVAFPADPSPTNGLRQRSYVMVGCPMPAWCERVEMWSAGRRQAR
jgi:hypothetical protein